MTEPLTPAQRLIVALDVAIDEAIAMVDKLAPVVSTFKVGYWLLFDPDLQLLLHELRVRNKSFFLDAKLNDIPETVKHGVASAIRCGADFITVHGDDKEMLAAAMDGKGDSSIKVMAVTALTHMPAAASRSRFRNAMWNAQIAGCDGLIMSPTDLVDPIGIAYLQSDRRMLIAAPGVRLIDDLHDDHRRTGSPDNAMCDGADYIIVGRPIIKADDPLTTAEQFIEQITHGLKTRGFTSH